MKKKAPKLFLSRETLALLTRSQLEEAAGGAGTRDKVVPALLLRRLQ
jgi:hypothetical protein